ncbi:hypothetical protein PTW37_10165 [Arthrobacter agilis]|nr:hypothetical protein [Arthrobacter agilis]WDF32239.1 hypothetical protein PTW37_10165 [Arthrobacter agilis]
MRICIGFDGSDKDDFTGIRAETIEGWQFTPTYANRPGFDGDSRYVIPTS